MDPAKDAQVFRPHCTSAGFSIFWDRSRIQTSLNRIRPPPPECNWNAITPVVAPGAGYVKSTICTPLRYVIWRLPSTLTRRAFQSFGWMTVSSSGARPLTALCADFGRKTHLSSIHLYFPFQPSRIASMNSLAFRYLSDLETCPLPISRWHSMPTLTAFSFILTP